MELSGVVKVLLCISLIVAVGLVLNYIRNLNPTADGFDVTILAGESVSVEVVMPKDASIDYYGNGKDKGGFDMATKLGSNLTFTEQTASICRFEEIEIVGQNFGFDLENGITNVPPDLNQDHYCLQVRKIR